MSRMNFEDSKMYRCRVESGWYLASAEFVPADNFPITEDMPPMLILNPAGAIDVLMPASTPARKGLTFFLCNPSANAITLKTDGDAAFTTAIVLAAGENTIVTCTGSPTAALGWRGVGTASSA